MADKSMPIEYREYRKEDAASYLQVHDNAFPALPAEYWQQWTLGPVTAAVAVQDATVVGAVPFHFRDFLVRPGLSVPVAWEYSVCVQENLRGSGIGSGMMSAAKQFLHGRALAMMVYRNDEFSSAYRYYARNGHQDLVYLRPWQCHEAASWPEAVHIETYEKFLAEESQALALFANTYGCYGGYPRRVSGYYVQAVQTPEYAEVPLEFSVLSVRQGNALAGYAIVGAERLNPTYHMLELVIKDNDLGIARSLMQAFQHLAQQRQLPAQMFLGQASPYVPLLAALGFRPQIRNESCLMLMAHVLDPEGMASAVWRDSPASDGLTVTVWTPQRQVRLHQAVNGSGHEIILEMKEDSLTRLLFCRLDLLSAWAQEQVTAVNATAADMTAIADSLPFAPWAYHHLDYV